MFPITDRRKDGKFTSLAKTFNDVAAIRDCINDDQFFFNVNYETQVSE